MKSTRIQNEDKYLTSIPDLLCQAVLLSLFFLLFYKKHLLSRGWGKFSYSKCEVLSTFFLFDNNLSIVWSLLFCRVKLVPLLVLQLHCRMTMCPQHVPPQHTHGLGVPFQICVHIVQLYDFSHMPWNSFWGPTLWLSGGTQLLNLCSGATVPLR